MKIREYGWWLLPIYGQEEQDLEKNVVRWTLSHLGWMATDESLQMIFKTAPFIAKIHVCRGQFYITELYKRGETLTIGQLNNEPLPLATLTWKELRDKIKCV